MIYAFVYSTFTAGFSLISLFIICTHFQKGIPLPYSQFIPFTMLFRICNLFLYLQHRLSTILDYERIIVLEQGRIVEDGNPRQLQQDASSLFYALLHKAGQSS